MPAAVIFVNLWMLRSRNGMYWYALDYLARIDASPVFIVRRGADQGIARELTEAGRRVIQVGAVGFARLALASLLQRRPIFTPTPHPIPFLANQMVVLHDPYPFRGLAGRLKHCLFLIGTATSRCKVAYISRHVCLPFLEASGIPASRQVFAPNIPPPAVERTPGTAEGRDFRLVAVGTDSRKKRYERLLELGIPHGMRLLIHGSRTPYVAELQGRFGTHSFTLITPQEQDLPAFMAKADAIVSVAEEEGFGRPLAMAILMGIPCHLLASAAFREFFEGNALLYPTIQALLKGLAERPAAPSRDWSRGFLGADYRRSIDDAVAQLQKMAPGSATPP